MKKLLKLFITAVFLLIWVPGISGAQASANKFDIGFGAFAVTAKTSTASGSSSGPGLYQFNFRRAVTSKLEIAVGYTVYFTNFIAGDSGSGLDLGGNYFPFTTTGPTETKGDAVKMEFEEIWRPFLGVTFNQRNFQSVQATYSGFGVLVGIERAISSQTNINATGRMISLNGPKNSSAKENDFYFGLGFKF